MSTTNYSQSFERLAHIISELRTKCPWDKKQTIDSLRQLTIEETYELADAITNHNWENIKSELGDLLLHIVMYATIAAEAKHFTIDDVIEKVCNKLVHRHPHIYEYVQVKDDKEVKKNWEDLKLKEGNKSVLSGVPKGLPAVMKSLRLQEKAKYVGFEWNKLSEVKNKIDEELKELDEAVVNENQQEMEKEFGDVLFSMINYARYLGIDPENALEKTNQKFQKRFMQMESLMVKDGKSLSNFSLAEMDTVWNQIKKHE